MDKKPKLSFDVEAEKERAERKARGLANLKPAKPGEVRNPAGSNSHNPLTRALRKMTVDTYRDVIELVLEANIGELQRIIKDPKSTSLKVGVAAAFLKAIRSGDYATIERIAERIVGKIPDELNVHTRGVTGHVVAIGPIDKEKLKAAIAQLEDDV